MCTMELRYNEPLYNEVLGTTNDFLQPSKSKIIKKEFRKNETSIKQTHFPSPFKLFTNSRLCKWALVAQVCLKTLYLWIGNPCDKIVGTLNDISHVFATLTSSNEQCCTEADAIFRKWIKRAKFGRDWKGGSQKVLLLTDLTLRRFETLLSNHFRV